MIKPELWNEKGLSGVWQVTYKIDGVRALITEGVAVSRKNKPLHNLQDIPDGDYEIYLGNWEDTVSAVRTHNAEPVALPYAYDLHNDKRLQWCAVTHPSPATIRALLKEAVELGYEGLVLRQGDRWIKVKTIETYDVPIIGINEGKGRNKGRLGAFVTPMGNVGAGLTDAHRELFWRDDIVGQTLEVLCMELTPSGKFRHPRFSRLRWDK